MSKLREKMKMDLELRGYSPKTVYSYLKYVKQYALHFSTSPELLGEDEVREFLHYLITEKKVCTSYVNGTYIFPKSKKSFLLRPISSTKPCS